ncbi:MAG TPA: amphi-Trp domain-containing protein [Marinagarivorans sp.]
MSSNQRDFRHESIQDGKSIQDILKAITKGLASGKLCLSDDDGEVKLEPKGLLNLKVTARQAECQNRLDIRITWQDKEKELKKKSLTVR